VLSSALSALLFLFAVFFPAPPPTPLHPLSLHDALPISFNNVIGFRPSQGRVPELPSADPYYHQLSTEGPMGRSVEDTVRLFGSRSEEHTSELQSRENLVCRLLLEKKKNKEGNTTIESRR